MGRCECCRVEKGAAAASFHAGSPSDLDLPDEQPVLATRTTSSSWLESERAFFGVSESSGGACWRGRERTGHASQQRHHAGGDAVTGMAVAFVCAARLHAHRVTAAAVLYLHSQCSVCSTHARYVYFSHLPTASPSPSPCWRCTTRCCGEAKRHHIRLYHGWPARVATCALLARLPAQRCACGSQYYCHYLIPRGHQSKHAQH